MATIKDLANRYGLEDYEQLLGGYPNAEKFITGLKDAAVRSVPTTEQMRDPNFIIDTAGLGGAIKAYHGTPHLFDRFDMSKLGTGEGAQAYGHGLYFAQDPSIAESYRKNLTANSATLNDKKFDDIVDELDKSAFDYTRTYGSKEKALDALNSKIKDASKFDDVDWLKIVKHRLENSKFEKPQGNIYETSIQWPNAEREAMDPLGEHHLLDWNQTVEGYVQEAIPRKIRELQNARDAISSKYVDDEFNPDDLFSNTYSFPSNEDKAAMDKIAEEIVMHKNMSNAFEKGAEGSVIYNKLIKILGSQEKASEYLHSIDIPGIKYLDASSRNTDKGTRNFVTFGDEYPQIVKRAGSLDELQEKYAEGGAVDSAISDYKQLLSGYPNATKFVNALQSNIESHIPTTEDLQSPERMGEWSLAAALNQPTGLATKPIKNLNQALLDKYIERGYLPEDELSKYEKNAAKMRNAGRQDINVQNAQANPEYEAYKAEYDVPFMHGTERLDRVLSKEGLDPKRATSGPMLYGTDSPEIASSYAKNKQDTSMMDDEDWDYSKAFTVAPQQLGHRGTIPYTVEQSWNYLDPEVRRDILTKAPRVGYSDLDQWQGDFVLHPEGEGDAINKSHYDYILKNSRGNPLKAMRDYWLDSGNLFNEEEKMSQLYRLAGYPHEISQEMAPWTKREGVLTGVSRIRNPLDTSNVDELREKVIPALKDAFKNDRSRKKDYGADSWDKNTRYTPKEWVNELEDDLNKGENSYVWTSIPDKITSELKRLGYNGIYDTGGKSAGEDSHQVTIPFNPSQIRSKFAAFDPILKHSPNLLAGTALGSVLLHDDDQGYAEGGSVDKDSLQLNKPQRTPSHPTKSHIVKTMVDGKEKIIRFGEQGAETAGKPKEGESDRMTAKRESFKARHAKNIAKGPSSAAYWANKVKWAEGGSVSMEDLPFNDPDQLRLYHQAMQHFDDLMENTGGSKKMGKTEARINYNTTTKGDRDRDKDLHTLIADYGIDVGKDAKINATMIKPIEAEGVYLGNLSGSVPVGEGRASLGLQGLHTKYSDGLSGYTAGYNGKVGGGDLSASYFEPADHNSAGRQVQLEYSMPFADGGSVDTTFGLSLNHGLSGIASTANTSNDQPVVNTISPNQVADATPKYKSPYYHAEFNPTGNLVYTTRPGTNPGMPDAIDRIGRDKDGNWHDYGTEGLVMYGDTPMTSRQNIEFILKDAQQKADDMLATQRAMVVVNAMPFNPFNQSWNDTMADPLKDPNNPAYQARQNVLDWQKHLDTFEPYKPFTPPQAYSHGGTVGYADGGSVSEFEDPAHERLYRRAMAHFDDMSAKQNFEDNDSMIASTILHPVEAAKRAGNAFMRSVDTAGGRPKQALDESSWYPVGIAPSMDEQAQAGLDLAGLAQTGAMPFAPSGAGSLGTIKSLNFGDLDFDPRFAYDKKTKWELPRLKQMTVELDVPEKEIPVVGLDKAVNKGVSSGMSDRSGVQVIRSINDVPVDEHVKGGQPFMHHFGDFGWMSNQGPATALNNSALEMYNQTGDYPFFLPFAMSPAGSDFNPSTGLTMFKYMTNNMNKKEQKALNKDLKLFIPGFKGIETEEGREQFQSLKGDDRKEVQKFLHTNYRDKGGLSIGEVRLAMADQDQLTIPDGTLLHMARLYPDNAITKENFHQAYSHALKGIGLGKLDRHIMAHEIYPHIVEERKIANPRQPSLDDMTSLRYATTESRGIMTPEILRKLGYAFSKGGSVGLQELANKYM